MIGVLSTQPVQAQLAVDSNLLQCVNPDVQHSLLPVGSGTVFTTDVPEQLASITVPADFEWIGSMQPASTSAASGTTGDYTAAAFRTGVSRAAAHTIALSALEADGWRVREQNLPPGLASLEFPQPDQLCRDDAALALWVEDIDANIYVRYVFPIGSTLNFCGADSRIPGGTDSLAVSEMPAFDYPIDLQTGRVPRSSYTGVGFSSDWRQTRAIIKHSASLAELTAYLSQQLTEQGWSADTAWQGATTAGSSWHRRRDGGTAIQGTLDVTATDVSEYSIDFRAVLLR
jgi:hypothetical protein